MKFRDLTILLTSIFLFLSTAQSSAQIRAFYQIKTYTFETEEQEKTTDDYLENGYLPALKRQMIENVGVFKNRKDSEADTILKTIVIIPFISLFQFQSLNDQLDLDETYLSSGKAYLEAPHDKPPYKRIESVLLKAFKDMPMLKPTSISGPRKDRIYELRSYESATEKIYANKMHMFNEGGEIKLFEELEFHAVFYGEVIAGSKMPNLMYMTTHKNQAERDLNWKKFVDSDGWKKMSSLPEYQNNVSHIDIEFLYPTSYSDY